MYRSSHRRWSVKKRLQHRSFSGKLRKFIRTPIFKLQMLAFRCNFIMEGDSLLKSFLNNDSLQTCYSIFAGISMRIISLNEPSWHDSSEGSNFFSENRLEGYTVHNFNIHLLFNLLLQRILYIEPHALLYCCSSIFQLVTQLNDPLGYTSRKVI